MEDHGAIAQGTACWHHELLGAKTHLLTSCSVQSQADIPLPAEEVPNDDPADQDSRIRSDAEDSGDEVMQEQQQDVEEEEDGEDLMDNLEGCVCYCNCVSL